jgi:hypothetical protein
LIAADLDGDGKPDIVTANDGSSDVSVLYNRGDGTFRDVVYYPILLDQRVEALSLIAADLDDDGKPDIGIGYRFCDEPGDRDCESGVIHSGIAVLLNQSNGIFKAPASYPVFGGQTLTATDLNGDGKLDFATDGVYVLLNNGDGTFALARHYPGQFLRITADLNMDGKPDLVTADNGHYSVLLNQGDGTFKVPVEYPGCALRGMVDTDFGRRWTAISREAGQPFQAKVDTDFRGIWTGLRSRDCQFGRLRGRPTSRV